MYPFPRIWDSGIKHVVQCITEVFRHDDSSIDGQSEISQSVPDNCQHSLHPVDLLSEEDGQWCHVVQLL